MDHYRNKDARTAAALTAIVWLSMFGLLVVPQLFFSGPPSAAITINVASSLILSLAASTILYRLAQQPEKQAGLSRYTRLASAVLLLGLALAVADAVKDVLLMRWLEGAENKRNMFLYVAGGFAFFVQGLAINSAFYVILRRGAELRQRGLELAEVQERAARAEVAAAQAEAAASNARLAALRYQLNPHFLFNTLNAISSMVVTNRNGAAEGMLTRLSEFLRSTLASKPDALVPIEDELASLANYLEIESFRLRDRLNFEVDCPQSLAEVPVPSFLLQPLVENAIKHGVAPTSRPVTISVRVARVDETLTIEVRDTGGDKSLPARATGFGLGLDNVRERLRSVYGPGASLSTESLDPGFAVTLQMPIVEARTLAAA